MTLAAFQALPRHRALEMALGPRQRGAVSAGAGCFGCRGRCACRQYPVSVAALAERMAAAEDRERRAMRAPERRVREVPT